MGKKEIEQKLMEINVQLKALGDLSVLIQQANNLPNIISDFETKKNAFDVAVNEISKYNTELMKIISDGNDFTRRIILYDERAIKFITQVEDLQKKVLELVDQTNVQLGIAASAKLASTFEQVKGNLSIEKSNRFHWFVGGITFLTITTSLVIWWQLKEVGTFYHLSFPLRVTLLSPIIYFVVFIHREYNRIRSLIEEYTFKAAIARSFEAYKEIVQGVDSGPEKTLDFILRSIRDLYSSPMVNIKRNKILEEDLFKPVDLITNQK